MTSLEKAKEILTYTSRHPRMYVTSKEALLARVSAILEMADIFDSQLYDRHVDMQGNMYRNLSDTYSLDWSKNVINDAFNLIDKKLNG